MTTNNITITFGIMFGRTIASFFEYTTVHPDIFPKTVIFGEKLCDSSRSMHNKNLIPHPIWKVIDYLDDGRYSDDLYVNVPVWSNVEKWRYLFDSGIDIEFGDQCDLDEICGIIRLWFKYNPVNIFTIPDCANSLSLFGYASKITDQKKKNGSVEISNATTS
eukprot:TRINITY_DN7252_c0_g1_i2.p1 TRINITY_DN7252_c0_g1~~TRINITY_DN7252_c0_g1_i2.p1  ORF type:complete len:162 (-),score=26.95 TRINITY_DN7252_c0_g1_i2:242-727(-)